MHERERLREALMDSATEVDRYARSRRIVEKAIYASVENTHGVQYLYDLPCNVSRTLDDSSPEVFAAMLMGAVSYRGYLYQDARTRQLSYPEIWHGTSLQLMAEKCESIVSGIAPKNQGLFTSIDIDQCRLAFTQGIVTMQPENVILTGLNGVGKSTTMSSLLSYLEYCGLEAQALKFPRVEGPLSDKIIQVLKGEIDLDPRALQYLMMADAIDYALRDTGENDTDLQIYDRHPIVESLVYGGVQSQPSLLAARELFVDRPSWVVILDRHPAAALNSVRNRESDPRIFESKLEAMVEQTINFAALTALPGVRWVNNDISQMESQTVEIGPNTWDVEVSKRRVVGSLITSGVVSRALIRQGKFTEEANAMAHAKNVFIEKIENWLAA